MAKHTGLSSQQHPTQSFDAIPTDTTIERPEICRGNSFGHTASNKVRQSFKQHAMTLWLATHASAESTFQLAMIFL